MVQKLDISGLNVRKASDEEIARFKKIEELRYTRPINLENHPSQKIYAEVIVNGKSVAKVYNSGAMETSNAMYGKVSKLDSVNNPQGGGPMLAQERAEDIAKLLGGKVVKSSTAITPAEWAKVPPIEFEVDYAAMEQDRNEALLRAESAKTVFQTQVIAQNEGAEVTEAPVEEKTVADEFLEFAEKSYEEKIYEMMLKRLGLTEDDLNNMSPEARAEVERKIEEMIKAEIKEKTGIQTAVLE
jgi:hypothetical protein